jgi:hypothetical protein
MVEFEVERYRNDRFHLFARRRGAVGEARLDVADVAGFGRHGYAFGAEHELEQKLALAVVHLEQFGLPWLAGAEVRDPAAERVREAVRERASRDAVSAGTSAFKAGDYESAASELDRASTIRPLDPLSEQFLALARKRASRGK